MSRRPEHWRNVGQVSATRRAARRGPAVVPRAAARSRGGDIRRISRMHGDCSGTHQIACLSSPLGEANPALGPPGPGVHFFVFRFFRSNLKSLPDSVTRSAAPLDVPWRSGVVGGTRNASSDVLCPHKLTPVHRRSLRGTHWCLSAPHTTVDDGLGAGPIPETFCIDLSSTRHHCRVSYRCDGGHRDIRRSDRVSVLV